MKLISTILFAALLLSCGGEEAHKKPKNGDQQLALSSKGIGRLRPFQVINNLLHSRAMSKSAAFDISKYIEAEDPLAFIYDFDASLKKLLGTFNGKGLVAEYIGAEPNAMNLLLWRLALTSFANDLAATCYDQKTAQEVDLNASFRRVLFKVCHSSDKRPSEKALKALWQALLNADAPESDFFAWQDFLVQRLLRDKESMQVVLSEALLAALYSPYFLVEH